MPPIEGMRPFGWAGLLMQLPEVYRPMKFEGDADRGRVILGDNRAKRLELVWGQVRARRFDPRRLAIKRLKRAVGRKRAGMIDGNVTSVDHPHFDFVMRFNDRVVECDRYIAYSEDSTRVFDMVYHHDQADTDRRFNDVAMPTMCDQPKGGAQFWALFANSFISPAGYVYAASVPNLGDLSVTLWQRRRLRRKRELTVRQIYPARLALARQPLEKWIQSLTADTKSIQRPRYRKMFRRGGIRAEPVDVPIGSGYELDTRVAWQLQLFRGRRFRHTRVWLIHDEANDRLAVISVSGPENERADVLEAVWSGWQWARRLGDEAR